MNELEHNPCRSTGYNETWPPHRSEPPASAYDHGQEIHEVARPQWKQEIIDQFAAWLDELEELPEPEDDPERSDGDAPDLQTLLREFTALRQEVRLQSRSGNKIGEQVEHLAADLTKKLNTVERVAASLEDDIPKARRESKKGVVLELLDVLEAIERSVKNVETLTLPRLLISARSRERTKENLLKSLQIVNNKTLDLSRRLGLEKTAAVGMPFDAETMRAVSTTSNGDNPANSITQVLRQGYRLDGEIIQTAEVKVEK